jgi:uncharacterized membrane protein
MHACKGAGPEALVTDDTAPISPHPADENVRVVADLERRASSERRWTDRLSERISRVAGSIGFVLAHLILFSGWAAWNAWLPQRWQFDPYPYGLLTFIVSLEGVLIATFVLITQNRMSRRDQERDHLHLQIALLSEQELTVMLSLLRRIAERVDAAPFGADAARADKLTEVTDLRQLMDRLRREFQGSDEP